MAEDKKEQAEREEAATRYLKEEPKHFVQYAKACEDESYTGSRDMRWRWDELLDAYDSIAPTGQKEPWQSDVVTDKPFVTIQHGKSIIRKALLEGSYQFYNLTPKRQYTESGFVSIMQEFGKVAFDTLHSVQNSDFITNFVDAAEMAFTVGTSFEMIPIWVNGTIKWELTPPWQIYRDPYASPRDPQSGNYWIRETWQDKWELLQLERRNIYHNIEEAMASTSDNDKGDRARHDKEYSTRRTNNLYKRNDFINSYRVMDFYGRVMSPKGELLIDRGNYTVLGSTVIRAPRRVRYPTLRWPGINFSALPHLLRSEGNSMIGGVLSLWDLFNNLLNLHMDNLNWQVNNIWERRIDMLVDPNDDELYPGKNVDIVAGAPEVPAHRPLLTKSTTAEALANMQYLDGLYTEGSFTPNTVTGLPGYRQEVTKGEYEGAQAASMGVFHSMAKELETGAIRALWAAYEIAMMNMTTNNMMLKSPEIPEEARNLTYSFRKKLSDYVDLSVTGISDMASRTETLIKLNDAMNRMQDPIFARYMKPYNLLNAYYQTLNIDKFDIVVDNDKAKEIDKQVQARMQSQDILFKGQQKKPGQSGQ